MDKQISEEELVNWIRYVQNRYITVDTERQWADHTKGDRILWEDYKNRHYGFLTGGLARLVSNTQLIG